MAYGPRKNAEAMAAILGISRHSLADIKIGFSLTWSQIEEQLSNQLTVANQYAAGIKPDLDLLDQLDLDELPVEFTYYHIGD